jgi:hypothetical protein
MRLKLIFKGNNAYLATEQGDIIKNVTITRIKGGIIHTSIGIGETLITQQTMLEINLDGINETIPSYIESTIIEVPQQTLLETKKGGI